MAQLVLFNIVNGLIVGAFYALMALGLSLIMNLSGVINFAHGGFLALGTGGTLTASNGSTTAALLFPAGSTEASVFFTPAGSLKFATLLAPIVKRTCH